MEASRITNMFIGDIFEVFDTTGPKISYKIHDYI